MVIERINKTIKNANSPISKVTKNSEEKIPKKHFQITSYHPKLSRGIFLDNIFRLLALKTTQL